MLETAVVFWKYFGLVLEKLELVPKLSIKKLLVPATFLWLLFPLTRAEPIVLGSVGNCSSASCCHPLGCGPQSPHTICSKLSLLASLSRASADSHAVFFHLTMQVRTLWQEDIPETLQKLRSSCGTEGSKHATPANTNRLVGCGPLSSPQLMVFCVSKDGLSCFPCLASLTHRTDSATIARRTLLDRYLPLYSA